MSSGVATPPPMDGHLADLSGRTLLAYDAGGKGRVVEVFGDLAAAEHVAIVVPGNAHHLGNYLVESAGASPRANGRRLASALAGVAPQRRSAVIVWLGYDCPRGFIAGARRSAADAGAADLRALVVLIGRDRHLTLIGHSYGGLVCAMAADREHVDDLVALASPGLGVRRARDLPAGVRVWAGRTDDDWVRWVPRGRIFGFGHGRQPADPRFGATRFSTDGARGHSHYYAADSESLRNIARITAGLHDQVTLHR